MRVLKDVTLFHSYPLKRFRSSKYQQNKTIQKNKITKTKERCSFDIKSYDLIVTNQSGPPTWTTDSILYQPQTLHFGSNK